MATRVHHATAKRAKKLGLVIEAIENEFTVSKDGVQLASHASASVALDAAVAKLNDDPLARVAKATKAIRAASKPKAKKARKVADEDGDEDGDEDDKPEGNSIIKRKYKESYKQRALKVSCSDEIAVHLAAHLKVKGDDGKPRIDPAALKRLAQANGCWDPKYVHLNMGQQRMNVVNRLRAKVRRDQHDIVWAK